MKRVNKHFNNFLRGKKQLQPTMPPNPANLVARSGGIMGSTGGGSWYLTRHDAPPSPPCSGCGKPVSGMYSIYYGETSDRMCNECRDQRTEIEFNDYLKRNFTDDPQHCQDCFRHHKACICPKSEDLKKLKR
jgi:hypothetical protein